MILMGQGEGKKADLIMEMCSKENQHTNGKYCLKFIMVRLTEKLEKICLR